MRMRRYRIPTAIELKELPDRFYDFAVGLYLLHMALMAQLTSFFPGALSRFRMPSFLLVALMALAAVGSRALFRGLPLRCVLAYFIFLSMALSAAVYQPENFVYMKELLFQGSFIKFVLIFSALFIFEEKPDVRTRQLTVIALAALLMYQYGVSHGMLLSSKGQVSYMAVGYGCAPWWVILAQGIFYYRNKLVRLACLIGSLYFAGFIINYGNRGALAVIAAALLILLIMYVPLKYLALLGGLLSLLAVVILPLFFRPIMELAGGLLGFDLTRSRNFRLLSSGILGYDSGRIPIFRACFDAILRHPFLGNGSGADRAAVAALTDRGPAYAHNILVELCVDFGVIAGALVFGWLLYIGFRMLFKCRDRDWRALFFPFYTFSMVELFFSETFYQSGYLLAAVVIYLTYSARLRPRSCAAVPQTAPVKGGCP